MALALDPTTGRYIDDGARATAMQAQLTQPVTGVRGVVGVKPDATAGLPVAQNPVPMDIRYPDDASRAAGMQAQFAQPVLGMAVPPQPVPFQNPGDTPVNSALAGVAKIGVGGIAAIPAMGLDAVLRGLTNVAGGDPNTLPGGPTSTADAAFSTIHQGVSDVGNALSTVGNNVQSGLRGALGVKPAQPAAAPLPAPVATQPVAAATQPAPAPQAAPAPAPAATPPAVSAGLPQSTNNVAPLTQGSGLPVRNGITGGFGTDAGGNPISATAYLDKMHQQDLQQYDHQQTAYGNLAVQQGMSRLQDASGDPVKYRQRLAEQRLIEGQVAGGAAIRNDSSKAQAASQAQLALAGINNTAAANRALAAGQAGLAQALQVANLTGQYGLKGAQIKADAVNYKTNAGLAGPAAQLAAAQAAAVNERLASAQAAYSMSAKTPADLAAYTAAVKESQVPRPVVAPFGTNPISGEPNSQATATVLQGNALITAKRQQDALLK